METDMRSTVNPSMTSLVREILQDTQQLIRQQIALFHQEIRDDLRKTRDAAILVAVGIGVLAMAGAFLLIALPLVLNWYVPSIPLWGCFAIMGVVLLLFGAILVFVAVHRLRSVNPLHSPAVDALKENLKWTILPK